MTFLNDLRTRFFKTKKYRVNGKEIIIVDESKMDEDLKNLVRESIVNFCKTEKVVREIPKISFQLTDRLPFGSNSDAWVDPANLTVYLSLPPLRVYDQKKESALITEHLNSTLQHELTHVWHEFSSKSIGRFTRSAEKLQEALKKTKSAQPFTSFYRKFFNNSPLRTAFHDFFRYLVIEGLAQYNQVNRFEKRELKEFFLRTYKASTEDAKSIIQEWNDTKEGKRSRIFPLLKTGGYTIGYHIISSLLYLNSELTIKKIAKQEVFKVIQTYESLMIAKGYQPIVSITSGKGIIDYQRILRELKETFPEQVLKEG